VSSIAATIALYVLPHALNLMKQKGYMKMSELVQLLGKGPGYVALAVAELGVGAWLAARGADLSGFALVLGAVNAGVYGGGAWKVAAEARNGGGNGK
jgi:hypothetical protein